MALKNNTWKLNQWYAQDVAGNIEYSGTKELWTWGVNESGELGQNSRVWYSSPVQLPGNWSSMSVGRLCSAAIKSNELYVLGRNDYGILGLNQSTPTRYSSPVQIPGSWSFMDHNEYASMGIKTDGTLWCWGRNGGYGTLGQNNDTEYSSPVQIYGGGTTWRHAACGELTTLATKTDGTLWGWGWNYQGNLGQNQNTTTSRSSPIQVGTDTTWGGAGKAAQIYETYLNIKTDGTLWGMGENTNGELGNNDVIKRSSPIQVSSDTTWSGIAGCHSKSFIATKTDGTLWSWGGNQYGELGQNDRTNRSSPVQIPGTTWNGTENIGGGDFNFGVVKTDGTLWMWGANDAGALGVPSLGESARSSPVQVPGTTWYRVTGMSGADGESIMALRNI